MSKKILVLVIIAFSIGGSLVQYSYGQSYPTRPIEILVGYGPGSSFDLVTRLIAETAQKYLGQSLVVVNKPGGAGSMAAADVISSKPDGYKIMLNTTSFFATIVKTQKVPYDPNSLIPLANIMQFKGALLVRGDTSWNNIDDLLGYAKKNPGKLRWNHPGRGTPPYFCALLMFKQAGVETLEVPGYNSSPESIAALLGGHIDVFFGSYGPAKDHIKTGRIKCFMTFSDRRFKDPADIPCAPELGFPDLGVLSIFAGIYAHKDTPKEIVKTLQDAFKNTCEDPEFLKSIEKIGEEQRCEGTEFIRETIRKTEELAVPILKELGLYVEK